MAGSTTTGVVLTWSWTGKTRRHTLTFRHSVVSGAQRLEVDGAVIHEVSWKYKLAGVLYFPLDDALVELHIAPAGAAAASADGSSSSAAGAASSSGSSAAAASGSASSVGRLTYTLTVDAKVVPSSASRAVSTWVAALADGIHQVELEHATLQVLVDGGKVEAAADFAEEGGGSAYVFPVGDSGAVATRHTGTR